MREGCIRRPDIPPPFRPFLPFQGKGAKDCGSKPTMRTK